MDNSSYFSLGATLYTPCNHPNLQTIMSNGLGSKSMVFCTEDAVPEHELEHSIDNLRLSIKKLSHDRVTFKRFIRPRTPSLLAEIMQFDGIENIDGFKQSTNTFEIMPLESLDVMEPLKLPQIRESLNKIKGDVICLRIGGNDLFNILGIKRMPKQTIYDTPLRIIIENLIINFRPYGYELSSPVFDMIDDQETLNKELTLDVNYGFFGKTAIHPKQVSIIEDFFKSYSVSHIEQADSVFKEYTTAVYRMNGQMMEVTCHSNWAKRTISLANSF
ncbi:ATP/GTP-binding protein [Vibrio owensii]|uniref:HpcH/HpaI aldolase/citrate lyase family protein n=1 Tax=Vibrio owensii TaxID=696485 RepID=UPI000EFA6A73|nr:HpcH/HpaI aldolase/citrate lyase family protein [Vibrio owensii]AYO20192.1 ATP/GTP-binding protein [Vibrio owensii]